MLRTQLLGLFLLLLLAPPTLAGKPSVSFGFHFGGRPYCGPRYRPYRYSYFLYRPAPIYYVRPRPRIVVEQPVVVQQPSPVIVQQQPAPTVLQSQPAPNPQGSVSNAPPPRVLDAPADPQALNNHLNLLRSPDKTVRQNAVMELGRMRAAEAVQPLAATLAGDQDAEVRDAAARALGLIGSPRGLASLTYAAQADADRDVRRSAQFAVEIIKANQRSQ